MQVTDVIAVLAKVAVGAFLDHFFILLS